MILDVTGDKIEGYGKASVVGMGGELEHAQALTHTLFFGNQYRDAVGAPLEFRMCQRPRRVPCVVVSRPTAAAGDPEQCCE